MAVVRKTIILVFGAIPATFVLIMLGPFAVVGGAASAMSGDLSGILVVVFAIAAMAGTMFLWLAIFVAPDRPMLRGLVAGMIAIGPMFVLAVKGLPTWNSLVGGLLIVSPFCVSAYLIAEYFVRKRSAENSTNNS